MWVAAIVALSAAAACQNADQSASATHRQRRAGAAPARTLSGNAAIAGNVYLAGAPPPRSSPAPAPECIPAGGGSAFDPAVRSGVAGGLAGTFVYAREGAPPVPPDAAAAPVEVTLDPCGVHPRVVGLRVGQSLRLINQDARPHTVVARDDKGSVFEVTVAPQAAVVTPPFSRPALMARLSTEGQPPLRGYVGVVDHPWFAVTDTTGGYVLANLPGGTFAVAAWHEVLGQVVNRVSVEDGALIIVDFQMQMLQLGGGRP